MKVKVTRNDIEAGRAHVNSSCGCPIWHSIARKLKLVNADGLHGDLLVPSVHFAAIGRLKMFLPQEAIAFQRKLMKDEYSVVKPFTFETEVEAPK